MSRADGFARIPDWFLRDAVPALALSAHDAIAYVVLVGRSNSRGLVTVSYARVAFEGGMSESAAGRSVRRLVDCGLVEVVERSAHEQNVYRVAHLTTAPGLPPVPPMPPSRSTVKRTRRRERDDVAPHTEGPTAQVAPLNDALAPLAGGPWPPSEAHEVDTGSSEEEVDVWFDSVPNDDDDRLSRFEFATDAQLALLSDLHIQSGYGVPDDARRAAWSRMTSRQASACIAMYQRDLERGGGYAGPWAGEPDYDALTDDGRRWADACMVPADVDPAPHR